MWRIMWTIRTMSIFFAGLDLAPTPWLHSTLSGAQALYFHRVVAHILYDQIIAEHRSPCVERFTKKCTKKFTTEKSEKREPNLAAAFAHRAASRNFAPNAFSAPGRKGVCGLKLETYRVWNNMEIPKMSTWNTMKQNTQRNQGFSNKIQTFRISHEICRYVVNSSQGAAEELGCSSPSGHVLGCFWPRWYQVGPQTLSVFSSNRPIGRFHWLFRCFPQVTGVTGLLTCKMAESSSSVESVFNGKNRCFEHLKVI